MRAGPFAPALHSRLFAGTHSGMAAHGMHNCAECAVEALLDSERGVDVAIEALRRALRRGLIPDIRYVTDRLEADEEPARSPPGSERPSSPCTSSGTVLTDDCAHPGAAKSSEARKLAPSPPMRPPVGSEVAFDAKMEAVLELVLWKLDGMALARCAGACRSLSVTARDGYRWRTMVYIMPTVAHRRDLVWVVSSSDSECALTSGRSADTHRTRRAPGPERAPLALWRSVLVAPKKKIRTHNFRW